MALIKIDGNLHARCDIKIHDEKAPLKHVQATVAVDNGSVGIAYMGDYVTGQREIVKLTQPTTALITAKVAKDDIVVVCAPELIYQQYQKADGALKNYYNPANEPMRAYPLPVLRRFAVSEEAIDKIDSGTALAVGQFVVLQNGSYKMKASATKVDGATVGKISRVDQDGVATYVDASGALVGNVYKMYVIDVL